jgi:hypothetical protein
MEIDIIISQFFIAVTTAIIKYTGNAQHTQINHHA